MCYGSIEFAAVERRHGIQFDAYFTQELKRLETLEADGLVKLDAGGIALTPAGRLLMRTVAMTFDAYLAADSRAARMSRVI